jgi:histone H3/H4
MAKTKSKPTTKATRRSTRLSKVPVKFRPASADMPVEIQTMIRDVAAAVAAKSATPFAPEAVDFLEQALEPVFEALMVKALEHAVKAGRDSITEADLRAVKGSVVGAAAAKK